jgi:hypothetical protein
MNRLKESKNWARAAVETEDINRAVALWQAIFGADWFPSIADVEKVKGTASAFGAAAKAGTLQVASSGLVLPERRGGVSSVPAPATRFFGEPK